MRPGLDKKLLQNVLEDLSQRAEKRDVMIEMSVYGGAVMVFEYGSREMTRDVDVVVHSGKETLRAIVGEIAKERGWDADWLNDGVKGFVSANPALQELFSSGNPTSGLRVLRPTPEYLFAMKAMSMRGFGSENASDIADLKFLIERLGLEDADKALDIVAGFYPASRVSPKTVFGLQEIIGGMQGTDPDTDKNASSESGHDDNSTRPGES